MKEKKKTSEQAIKIGNRLFKIPPEGSLGLLALGSVGVRAWKKAKKEWETKQAKNEA